MKVLVTGGAGFIGSHLVDALARAHHDVVVVDHHRRAKKRYPNPAAKVYKIGFEDPRLARVFELEKPDAVCHLAAQISVPASVREPIFDAQVNIMGSLKLMDTAIKSGCRNFVFASSGGAIYGDQDHLPTPEIDNARPLSPYGIAKQSFEHYLDFYRQIHGIKAGVLRLANVYGPRQFLGGEAGVVSIFLDCLRSGEPVTIFAGGEETRDYLFVADAVAAFLQVLENQFDGTLNIATGQETSVMDLWQTIKRIHGQEHAHEFQPARSSGEVKRSCLDPSSAQQKLTWQPKVELKDGLQKTYDWFMGEDHCGSGNADCCGSGY